MLAPNIKFNQASFEYYMLHLTPKTQIEQIKNKLANFKKLDEENNIVVVVLDDKFDLNKLNATITALIDYTKNIGIHLHSILANDYLNVDKIESLPVIHLPKTKKSNVHIYDKTLLVDEPVRSGLKIENDGDIIVSSFVSDNAEIVASGNIHIYGEARGRIIAGSRGDKTARIFAAKFNAELISIGGVYKTIESKLPENIEKKAVMIMLDEKERLNIIPL